MCNPVLISLALSAAGTYAQHEGTQKAKDAMGKAGLDELERQKKLQGQSNTLLDESLNNNSVDHTAKGMDEQYNQSKDAIAANVGAGAATNASVASRNGTPQVVADEGAARSFTARDSAMQNANNAARMSAFGNSMLGDQLMNARGLQNQGMLSNFMQGSAGVLPYEMQSASHKGDNLKETGQGLQLAAMLTSLYGAMAPATAAETATETAATKASEATNGLQGIQAGTGVSAAGPGMVGINLAPAALSGSATGAAAVQNALFGAPLSAAAQKALLYSNPFLNSLTPAATANPSWWQTATKQVPIK